VLEGLTKSTLAGHLLCRSFIMQQCVIYMTIAYAVDKIRLTLALEDLNDTR
jgi:hypothetical protein